MPKTLDVHHDEAKAHPRWLRTLLGLVSIVPFCYTAFWGIPTSVPLLGPILSVAFPIAYVWWEYKNDIRRNHKKSLVLCLVFVALPFWIFRESVFPVTFAGNETIPGVALQFVVRIGNKLGDGKHYIVDYGTVDAARMSVFLSPNRLLVFSVSDSQGKQVSLSVPLGTEIPMDRFVFLSFELGIRENSTVLRILLNGQQIRYIESKQKIEMASIDLYRGVLGASLRGDQGASFDLEMLAIYSGTSPDSKEKKFLDYFRVPHLKYVKFNGTSWMKVRDFGRYDMNQPDNHLAPNLFWLTPEDKKNFLDLH
jgi:hypothetical protein